MTRYTIAVKQLWQFYGAVELEACDEDDAVEQARRDFQCDWSTAELVDEDFDVSKRIGLPTRMPKKPALTQENARRLADETVREWEFKRLYDYCATLRAEEYLEDEGLFRDDWELFFDNENDGEPT